MSSSNQNDQRTVICAVDHWSVVAEDETPDKLIEKLKALYRADSVFIGQQHVVVNRGCLSIHLKKQERKSA